MDAINDLARRGLVSRRAHDRATHDVTLYIVRHGCTRLNGEDNTSVDRIRGWSDVPLTDKGRQEARQAAHKLKSHRIGAVVSSDLSRATESADIICGILGLKLVVTHKLRPWDLGIFTGKSSKESLPEIGRYVTEHPGHAIPKGESFNTFCKRAFEGFYEAVADHPGKLVAIVTHHRDEMLLLAWDKAGQPLDHSIEVKEFLQRGDPPGGVHKVTTTLKALRGDAPRRARTHTPKEYPEDEDNA